MKNLRIIKIFGYMYELNKRNFKVYRMPKRIPCNEPIVENSIHWVGHATTVINLGGKIFITDPVIGNLGHIKRLVKPSIDLKNIKADYILITHGHMDHLDYSVIRQLNKDAVLIVPRGVKRTLNILGFKKVFILRPGEEYKDGSVIIKTLEANHNGKRYSCFGYSDSNSYIISSNNKNVLFAGDTAYTENYKGIKADAAVMPVGCYKPDEFKKMHCSPVQSFEMFKMMDAKLMIPIHYKTYILSQESDKDTEEILNKINDGSIKIIDVGQTVQI